MYHSELPLTCVGVRVHARIVAVCVHGGVGLGSGVLDSLGPFRAPVLRAELVHAVGTFGAPWSEAAPLEGAAAAAAAHEDILRQPYDERQVCSRSLMAASAYVCASGDGPGINFFCDSFVALT